MSRQPGRVRSSPSEKFKRIQIGRHEGPLQQLAADVETEQPAVERRFRANGSLAGLGFGSVDDEWLLTVGEPARGGSERTRHTPRVRAAVDILDWPSQRLGFGLPVQLLESVEPLGIEQIVSGEIGENDARWPMADDDVAQNEELLLRTEAGRPVVLDRDA